MQPQEGNNGAILVPWEVRQLGRAWPILDIDYWVHPSPRIGGCANDDSSPNTPTAIALGGVH